MSRQTITSPVVRSIGLVLCALVARREPELRSALHSFGSVSLGGLVVVIAGAAAGGSALYVLWGMAIVLDVVRAVAVTCGLWWSYFPQAKPVLEHALPAHRGAEQSRLARSVFSLLHFPMLCGVIAYAVAIEEVLAHPGEPPTFEIRVALALGLALFVGGMAAAVWRATGRFLVVRAALTVAAVAATVAAAGVASPVTLGIALVGLVLIAAVEQRTAALPRV